MISSTMKDSNDVAYAIAKRAAELADDSMVGLRMTWAGHLSLHANKRATRGMTRGQLIEAVLCEEFVEEYPRELEER